MSAKEIYFGALNLSPYLVRQDKHRFAFMGFPEEVPLLFYAESYRRLSAYIERIAYPPRGITLLLFGNNSFRAEFADWQYKNYRPISFYFFCSEGDFQAYKIQMAAQKREGFYG